MANKTGLPKGYSIETKFDSDYGAFATVQVLMNGENEVATIRNGKVVSSSDPKIAVGSSQDSAIAYINSANPSKPAAKAAPATPDTGAQLDTLNEQINKLESTRNYNAAIMQSNPVGSSRYNTAKAQFDQATSDMAPLQKQLDDLKTTETGKETADQTKTDAQQAQSDLAALNEKKQRAIDLGGDGSQYDSQIQAAQQKVNTTSAAAGVKPTTTPSGVTIPAGATDSQKQQQAAVVPQPAAPKSSSSSSSSSSATDSVPAAYTPLTASELTNRPVAGPQTPDEAAAAKSAFVQTLGPIGALALATPWMADIIQQAYDGKWSATKFTDTVQNYVDPKTGVKPWDQIGQSIRDSELAYYGNKQAWGQQYNDKLQILQQSATAQGLDPAVFGTALPTDAAGNIDPAAIDAAFKDTKNGVNTFFSQFYNNMPDQATVDKYVANHTGFAKTDQGVYGGTLGSTVDALKSYASQMGVASQYLTSGQAAPGTDYFANAASGVQKGNTTLEEQQNYIKQQAIAMYAPFAQRIKEGQTVQALASPYLNAAANLLEVDPSTIDLGATTGLGASVTKALQGDGTTPMSLDAFTTSVKQNPQWLQTTNARNSLMDTANTLLRNFGLVTGE